MYSPLLNIHDFENYFSKLHQKNMLLLYINNVVIEAGLKMSVYWNNIVLTSHPPYMFFFYPNEK